MVEVWGHSSTFIQKEKKMGFSWDYVDGTGQDGTATNCNTVRSCHALPPIRRIEKC